MTGVLLQVRLDSTRLPGKALLKVKDLNIVEHAMRSLKEVKADRHILVTTEDSIDTLRPFAKRWGFNIMHGSKENVLKRFIKAIDLYGLKRVIRATGDNPLVSYKLANTLLEKHITDGNDYSGFQDNPVGTGVEVVESKVLIDAYNNTTKPYDLEHVTPYIYNNPSKFRVFQGPAPSKYLLKNSYVTVDTKEDFNRIEKLYKQMYHGEIIPLESVVKWLKKEQLSSIPT